jgi:NAD+ synthase (glutamine-hydrolysing)
MKTKEKKQKFKKKTPATRVKQSRQFLKVYLAQINSCLGDFEKNSAKALIEIQKAKQAGAQLVIFPEAALFGYPPFDLLERIFSVENQLLVLQKLQKKIPANITVLLGCFSINPMKRGRPYFNSVAVLHAGKKIQFLNKTLLPTGDVFDEFRFCENGDITKNIIKIDGKSVLVSICEDIWAWSTDSIHKHNPILSIEKDKVDLIVNVSASPFCLGKWQQRFENISKTVQYFSAPAIYINAVGAQDELIFDGRSFYVNSKGELLGQLHAFAEQGLPIEISLVAQQCSDKDKQIRSKKKNQVSYENSWMDFHKKGVLGLADINRYSESNDECRLLRDALVLGIRDYCAKIGINKIHFGLSGGIDSALVACLATEAIGSENVTAIALPGPFNAPESYTLAKQLSEDLKINFLNWLIHPHFEAFKKEITKYLKVSELGLVHENLQARLRGLILMIFSNSRGSLLLSTSNKSEIATGYSTLYGDMCGGLAPIGDLTKAQVYSLSRMYHEEKNWIPLDIIERAPSAELRPHQVDQDSLPPYELLDKAVENIVEKCEPAKSKTENWLLSVLFRNEFKRWQSPPILKVSSHAFGRGRRYPIAHRFKERRSQTNTYKIK